MFRLTPLVLFVTLVGAAFARAQDARPNQPGVPLPVGIASDDGAFALESNPSLVTYVPRFDLVLAHARAGARSSDERGTSTYVALARPGRYGAAVGFDRREDPNFGARSRLTVVVAGAIGSQLSLGLAYRILASDGSVADFASFDLSATYRPNSRLSIALVGRDLLAPLDFGRGHGGGLPARFDLAAAFRPFGNDVLTTELAFGADTAGTLGGRLYLAVATRHHGRAYAAFALDDLRGEVGGSALAGLELALGGLRASGAGHVREGSSATGFLAYVGVDGHMPASVLPRRRLIEVVIDDEPSAREWVARLLVLDRALRQRDVDGVVLRLRDSGIGLAEAQEIRHVVAQLVVADKPVTCVLESPTGSELYACSGATEIHVEAAGTVRLLGPSIELAAYGGLLESLGVRADFVRIGPYKSAPERFTRDSPSAEAIEETSRYLDDAYGRMVQDLAADLGVAARIVREAIDEGPLTPERAIGLGLVDDTIDLHDLPRALATVHGASLPRDPGAREVAEPSFGPTPSVAVVLVEGAIVDRENVVIPFLGTRATGADTIVATLDRLRRDPSIAAVVLRIDSPGGSAVASERIWRAARRLGETKPLVASMGSIAASGGYYVATAARTVFANPTTLTGSIGVYHGKFDLGPLAARLGVGVAFVERGEHAGATSIFRPFDEGERAHLETLVEASYQLFLARVAEGRSRTVESLEGVAEGRIFSGDRARALGLVDRLGGLVAAVRHAQVVAGLPEGAPVVVLPEARAGLVARLVGAGVSTDLPTFRARGLAWLAFARSEGMYALAPIDRGAR